MDIDLNLLVTSGGGETVRYHVMGSPDRRVIERVIHFAGIPLDALDLPRRGYRDADRDRAGA